jgi:hypothetical protein
MGEPVKSFDSRLKRNLVASCLLAVLLIVGFAAISATLTHENFVTGWLLAAAIGLLATYNLRRNLPFLPLGSSSEWLQLHVYLGFLGIILFGLHVGVAVPNGPLEIGLASIFGLVAVSGIFGLIMARSVPQRLSRRGEEVLYDRIPKFRHQLMDRAEALSLRAVEETGSTTIADYYTDRLRPFFDGPRNSLGHVFEIRRRRHHLLDEMRDLERYLNENETAILRDIAELTRAKDDLDYHYALQSMMKRWQFIHVPLSFALIILVLLHLVVVYAFA